jgi:DNA-binding NarL/FixJ family response regulator
VLKRSPVVSQHSEKVSMPMEKIMKPLRILIADDHELFRDGVRVLLQSHPGWEICGEAGTGVEAVAQAEELLPDIVILDISMPDLNGADAARRIRTVSMTTEILILSMHYSDQLIREIIDAGALGYVLKSDSDKDLLLAVEALARHKPFFTAQATDVIHSEFNIRARIPLLRSRVTSREREIIQHLAQGKRSKEIASSLGISIKTVETHRSNVMRKLELHSLTELVRYAMRNQLIEP